MKKYHNRIKWIPACAGMTIKKAKVTEKNGSELFAEKLHKAILTAQLSLKEGKEK